VNPIELRLQAAVGVQGAGDVREAERLYREVLATHPRYVAAWEHLGHAQAAQGQLVEALHSYQQVLALDPNHSSALSNLGNVYERLGRLPESLACYDRAVAIDPAFVAARQNRALVLLNSGEFAAALQAHEEALRYAPNDAVLHKHVGLLRLMLGDFARGWPEYEWRYQSGDPALPKLDRPLWDGSALYGQTILLTAEPGLGDNVHFIRYAAWLKRRYKCRVLFGLPPNLQSLRPLISTCPGIDGWYDDSPPPSFDCLAPLSRVPAVLAHTPREFPAEIPYLTADPARVEQWRQRLGDVQARKIGIHWQTSLTHRSSSVRSIPLAAFDQLSRLSGVQLFSLQKGAGAEELQNFPDIIDLGRQLDETTGAFVETAAVLKNLDLLITCDTAIAHVAGALGVPVWVALCHVPDWRWGLTSETTAWYPTMRLFRQTSPRDWSGVFDRIGAALLALT
jgi:tetratricopeptide (TPR) repeat protein